MSNPRINRRSFLKIVAGMSAGLSIAACSGKKWPALNPATPVVNRPGPLSSTVAVVRAETYERKLVRGQVQAALDALGGIGDIVRPGASVALKVNLT
jgi:hypothetical protein